MTEERKNKIKQIIFKYLNTETPISATTTVICYDNNITISLYKGMWPDVYNKPSIGLSCQGPKISISWELSEKDFTKIEWAQILTKFEELSEEYEESLLNSFLDNPSENVSSDLDD